MHYRKLGTTEAEVSEIGYGASGIGSQGGADDEAVRALKRAFELGVNFVDTEPDDGGGHNERLVAKVVNDAYHRIYVATKIPPKNPAWQGLPVSEIFPYDHIVQSTEQSLSNLGVEQIYLQQFQVWTDNWVNADEWRRAVENLRSSGKVRFFGLCVSEHDPDSVLEAVKTEVFTAVQAVYNIFNQTAEQNLFPLCHQMKVGVLARAPWQDAEHGLERTRRVEELTQDLADVPGTLPQISVRFCISNKAVTSVIPQMADLETVESSCRAASGGMLDARTLAILKRYA